MTGLPAVLPPVLAAVLLSAAVLKTIALRRGALEWPILRLPGGGPVRPVPVIAVEAAVAVAAAAVDRPALAAGLLAVVFVGLSWAAFVLRGSRCACFGASARVGTVHMALTLLAVAASAAVAVVDPAGVSAGVRVSATVATALVVVAVAEWRRRARPAGGQAAPLSEATTALVIVVSDGCGACRALRARLRDLPAAWVEWRVAEPSPEDHWAQLAGHRFPCAVPIDAGGAQADDARWGVTAIVELADQLAVRRITTGS